MDEIDRSEPINLTKEEGSLEEEFTSKIADTEEELQEYYSKRTSLKISILAIFIALGPVLSISFIWLPYFEFMTLTIFIGGIILGPGYGVIQAVLSTTLFEIIVSAFLGMGLPVFPFKVLGFALVGLSGGIIGNSLPTKPVLSWRIFIAIVGGILTLVYDLLVNIGLIIFLDGKFISYFVVFVSGLPVTAIRVVSNTLFFTFVPEIVNRGIQPAIQNISIKKKSTNLKKEQI